MALKKTIAAPPGQASEDIVLTVGEEAAVDAEWSNSDTVATRELLRDELRAEALARIAAQEPAWDSFETVRIIASIWPRLNAPGASHILARDIYLYAKNTAIPKVDTLTTAEVLLVIPVDPQPFLAVDPIDSGWPT